MPAPPPTGMIEMAMRQDNGLRSGARSKTRFGRDENLIGTPGQAGIDQPPRVTGSANKEDVDETDWKPADIGGDSHDRSHKLNRRSERSISQKRSPAIN